MVTDDIITGVYLATVILMFLSVLTVYVGTSALLALLLILGVFYGN